MKLKNMNKQREIKFHLLEKHTGTKITSKVDYFDLFK